MNISKSINNLNKFEKCLWAGSALTLFITFLLAPNCDTLTMIASLIGVTSLIFVAKGDEGIDVVDHRFADAETIKKFNRIINSHKTEIIISSSKNLKDVT